MPPSNNSLLSILKQRQRDQFVGRDDQILSYERNLILPVERRNFIFNLSGQGGIGKTFLLRRFRLIAENRNAITAWSDESESDIPNTLGRMATQFEEQGYSLKSFSERYKVYRQRRQELETDPEAPQGLPGFIGKSLAKTGVHLARRAPGIGLAFDFIDEESLATQAGEWMTHIAKKISNKDEVYLLQEPVKVLTPLFLEGLRSTDKTKAIAIFFDTYERTSEYLDLWLRELLEENYGEVPTNIIISIAGQQELDKNLWAPYEGLISRMPLATFSPSEIQELLKRRSITDEKLIEVITSLSNGLPLLVATLATESPQSSEQLGDPSGTAVERFLKWVGDPKRRQIALDASIPRKINRDLFAVITEHSETDELFNWLINMPFVNNESWSYHNLVRSQMLRHKHRESPQSWSTIHGKLAGYYEKLRDALKLEKEEQILDPVWQDYTIDLIYHRLCSTPHKELDRVLIEFLNVFEAKYEFALKWAETVELAGEDTENLSVKQWGKQLTEALKVYRSDNYEPMIEVFSRLLNEITLDDSQRSSTLYRRSRLFRLNNQFQKAIEDLSSAIKLSPNNPQYYIVRAETYRQMERYKEALVDINKAIEFKPLSPLARSIRGEVYRLTGEYKKALGDFNEALRLNPNYASAIVSRGETYRQLKRYQDALNAFYHYIELDSKNTHFGQREIGLTLESLGKYHEALDYFISALYLFPVCLPCWKSLAGVHRTLFPYDEVAERLRSIEIPDTDKAEVLVSRGEALRGLGLFEEALIDFNRALDLNEKYIRALYYRSATYFRMNQYEAALADCNLALSYDPDDSRVIALRGEISSAMERHEEALEDIKHALELEPNTEHRAQKNIGISLKALKKYNEAARAFIKALVADPQCTDCWILLIETYQKSYPYAKVPKLLRQVSVQKGKLSSDILSARGIALRKKEYFREAIIELTKAIEVDGNNINNFAYRGECYLSNNEYTKAIVDLNYAIDHIRLSREEISDQQRARYHAMRAQANDAINHFEEALVDLNRAIQLDPHQPDYLLKRGSAYQWLGQYDQALEDFDYYLTLNKDKDKRCLLDKGLILSYLGRYAEAIDNYEQALIDDPESFSLIYNIAITKVRWQGVDKGQRDIERALSVLSRKLKDQNHRGAGLYGLGGLEAIREQREKAIDYLEQSISLEPHAIRWARHDIAWLELREDTRFQTLIMREN